jgi:hypothetical protein
MVYNPGGQLGKSVEGGGQRPAKQPGGPFLGKGKERKIQNAGRKRKARQHQESKAITQQAADVSAVLVRRWSCSFNREAPGKVHDVRILELGMPLSAAGGHAPKAARRKALSPPENGQTLPEIALGRK